MDGFPCCCRISDKYIDTLIAERQLQFGNEPTGSCDLIVQSCVGFNIQVDIPAARIILHPRTEEITLRGRAQYIPDTLSNNSVLLRCKTHSR